jgi:hypothetical protein
LAHYEKIRSYQATEQPKKGVFYGLDTMHYHALFTLTLGFTMAKIKFAEKAEILPPGDRMAFLFILS